jgi:hypothetical protein
MKTPILGSSYVARSVNAADSRMVNLFPEVVLEGGKEPAFLQRCAGLRQVFPVGQGPIRGLWKFGDYLYVASGGELYRADGNYNTSFLGYIDGSGPVSMVDNGEQLFIACNPSAFIYNASTGVFEQITDPDFPGAVTVGYLDGYFVFNQPNSQRFWVTSLNDGTQIDPLDFASAEGNPDDVVALNVNHREVWLFGTSTVEVWYNAGLADFPLARIAGAFMEVGCAAPYSVAKLDNSVFWLGSDIRGNGIIYRNNGYNAQRISTHAIEWQIQQYDVINDAIGYSYQQDGHLFYILTFPTANATWCYDATTGAWHERAGWDGVKFVRHRSNCQANFNNEILVGDWLNGLVYAFDPEIYSDNNAIQRWLRSWRALPTGQNDLRRTAHHTLQLDCEAGVGVLDSETFLLLLEDGDYLLLENGDYIASTSAGTVLGADPKVMLRWSDDGGHTWSNEHWSRMGKIGEYYHRVFWRRLGMTLKLRDRVYEISGTDPVKIAIMGAEVLMSPTRA